jgi:hypothetical protein
MVKILKITADCGREEEISKYLEELVLREETPRLEYVEKRFGVKHEKIVEIAIESREPSAYDALLSMDIKCEYYQIKSKESFYE